MDVFTDWPDRFIFVCNATKAAIVNLLPIVHAGPERIEKIFVFSADGGDLSDETRSREVTRPKDRLKAEAEMLSQKYRQIEFLERSGDPNTIGAWEEHMRTICSNSGSIPVLYCVTGGTKLMSLGGIIGGGNNITMVHTAGSPLRTVFISRSKNTEASRHSEVTIEQYLRLYGFEEVDKKQRMEWQVFCAEYQREIRRFANMFVHSGMKANVFNRLTSPLAKRNGEYELNRKIDLNASFDGRQISKEQKIQRGKCIDVLNSLESLPGIELKDGVLKVSNDNCARLLRGGWLEADLYNRAREISHKCNLDNSVEIATGLSYRIKGGTDVAGEIDVAVMAGSQIRILEAKTGSFGNKSSAEYGEKPLQQLSSMKRTLLDQHGALVVVNPCLTKKSLDNARGDFVERMKADGIRLLLGRDALSDAEADIRRWLQ